MQKKFTRRAVTTGALATFGLAATRVSAQAWPSRPIRFVVPFPAGNAGDITARLISTRLSEKLGASIVVENRAGASGLIGTQSVKTAEPDGYTFLVTSLSPMVVMPATRADLPYEPQKDFQGVSLIGRTAMALVASKSLTGETVKEVLADVKASPGKYLYGHIGTGSLSHLSMALMIRAAGLEMTAVPYKGSGEVMTELIAGRVHLMWDGMTSSLPQVQAGTVRGLAVSSGTRSGLAPNLPTMRDSNVPVAHDIDAWTGLLAPAGTPMEIVQRLNSEIAIIMKDPAFIERARTLFLDPYEPSTPAYFQDFLKTELEKWVEVHKAAGIKTVR
jgi:tripartite-type tricarboxylate transporter receptor subunit TctC